MATIPPVPIDATSDGSEPAALPNDYAALPLLLTVDEVAALLRTSRGAIYTMAERAKLPGVRHVGRRLLVCRDTLLKWLRETRVPSPERRRR